MKPSLGRFASLGYGFFLPGRAARLIIRRPPLLLLSLIPITLSIGLSIFLLARLQTAARAALVAYLANHWGLSAGAGWTIAAVFVVRAFLWVLGALSFSIVTTVVASPFNDWLAGRTENYTEPRLGVPDPFLSDRAPSWAPAVRSRLRLVFIDLGKSAATLAGSLLALAVSWIPGLNLAALALSCLLLTFQYVSYPQTRRGQAIGHGLHFLWRHFYACLGFGAALFLLFAIPLLSVFGLPLAVVGGTLLVARAPGGSGLARLR